MMPPARRKICEFGRGPLDCGVNAGVNALENKTLFIGVAVLVAAVLLVPMLRPRQTPPPPPPSPAAAPPAPIATPAEPAPPAKAPLDAAILEKLMYGMTYEQVVEVVGTEADESESQFERDKTGYTAPILTVWKTWMNPDGSKLRVGFVEGKLEQKQFKRRERNGDRER